jgi:tetratricopeptide (TPR) repeat protein
VAVSNATRALKILDSALVAAERELGGDDLLEICAIIMTNRSNVLSSLGRLDDALADLHRASELDQSRGTPSLEVKLNIANRLADAGNPEAALGTVAPLLEESIRANLEDGTPVRALALFNASTYLDAMGRLDEARQCLEAAIDVLRHAGRSGRDHVEVKSTLAAAYYNLSVTHAQFGDLSAARAAARRSLDVYRELAAVSPEQFGADEREGAKLLDSLG